MTEANRTDQRTAGEPETAESAACQPEGSAACPATRSRRQIDGGALSASHTPTPWKEHAPNIDDEIDETYREISAGCGFFPGEDEVGLSGFKLTGFIKAADARLIAAAPDLLQACKRLRQVINDHVSLDDVDALDAAIDKAEGRRVPEDYPPTQGAVIHDNGDAYEQRSKSPRLHDWTGPTRINKYVHCSVCGKIFEILKAKGRCMGAIGG